MGNVGGVTDSPPDEFGYWQASDGLWYPPEMHPFHHRARTPEPAAPSRRNRSLTPRHAEWVQPAHRKPGAGAYTAVPVGRSMASGTRALIVVLVVLTLVAGTVAVLAITGVIGDDDLTSDDTSFDTPSAEMCSTQRTALEVAIFNYKAVHGTDPTDEQKLVAAGYLDEPVELWDFTVDPVTGPVLAGADGC